MKEAITICLGQAGVQMGLQSWELFCLEHGISPHGKRSGQIQPDNDPSILFNELRNQKFAPRSLLIDVDPSVVDQAKKGKLGQLFNPNCMISGKQDAADNFARGYYTIGRQQKEICMNQIRKQVELCDNFEGFLFVHSLGGGTGSGLGSLLLNECEQEYCKKPRLTNSIFPSPNMVNSIVEPFNTIFSMHNLVRSASLTTLFDNQSLYQLCQNKLDIQCPNYSSINKLVAHSLSSLTNSFSHKGSFKNSANINEYLVNLVPYQRIHFMLSSLAPLMPADSEYQRQISVSQITEQCLTSQNMMVKAEPRHGKYIASLLMYRGDISSKEVYQSTSSIKFKKSISFTEYSPTGFKIDISSNCPISVPGSGIPRRKRSCFMLANSTAISELYCRIDNKFDWLYSKRAFVHWYVGEGSEQMQFGEARETMAALEKQYDIGIEEQVYGEGEQQEQIQL